MTPKLLPKMERMLKSVGENIMLARMRRKINKMMLAERAGIGFATMSRVESGDPKVSIGVYAQVLHCLGLESDVEKLGADDILGRKLQDIEMMSNQKDE